MSHAKPPPAFFLRTDRVGFRHWREDDLPLATMLWSDPEVTRLIGGPFNADAIHLRLAREIAQQQSHGVQYWPMFQMEDDAFAGCCGLRPYPREEDVYEIGFHLRPAFQGRGLANEAARAVIAYAFDALDAHALFAGHHPDNTGSAKALAKLGFRYDRDEFYEPTGRMHPSYLLTRSDFLATHPAR
ncbi:MAG TPA: GNAT family N-acetyltransferase [Xanthomonadaceae bacterium]|jgi:RimJ/RimL family protein N-acetyltransferase